MVCLYQPRSLVSILRGIISLLEVKDARDPGGVTQILYRAVTPSKASQSIMIDPRQTRFEKGLTYKLDQRPTKSCFCKSKDFMEVEIAPINLPLPLDRDSVNLYHQQDNTRHNKPTAAEPDLPA